MSQQISPIGEKPLTRYEAQELVGRIKKGVELLRSLLLELYERDGWKALGYDSWRSCVDGEFGQGQRQLYRQLAAGFVEKNLRHAASAGEICHVGQKPLSERALRPLTQLPPAKQVEVWREAVSRHGERPTGEQVKQVVDQRTGPPQKPAVAAPAVEDAKATFIEDPDPPKPAPEPKAPPRKSRFDLALDEIESLIPLYISFNTKEKDIVRLRKAIETLRSYAPTAASVEVPEWIDREAWEYFVVMRGKKKGEALTARAAQLIIKRLGEYRGGGKDPNEILNWTIENQWMNVYPPEEKPKSQTAAKAHTLEAYLEQDKNIY